MKPGATLNVLTQFYFGDANSSGGIYNQTGGDVIVGQQMRVGHFGNAVSTATISDGTLTLTGDSPLSTPSTSGAGGANATGDNNINALPANTILGGGIYLGIDGTGVLNHSGGTITTNWIVLDNRGNTGAGLNTPDGIDRYNLSGTGLLKLRSEWGLIARNVTTDVSLGGGTIQLDNTGTGGPAGNTGADLDVPLTAILNTVTATTTTLDTNGVDNSFILSRDVTGAGTLDLVGGGTVEFTTATTQNVSATLTGSLALSKTGTGTTVLTGSSGSYAGATIVNAGTLRIDGALGGSQTVKSAATLGGSGTGGAITVESGGILAPGASVGTLSGTTADLQAGSRYDVEITGAAVNDKLALTGALTANGSIKVILSGYVPVQGNTFDIADASGISGSPTFDFTAAALTPGLAWDTSDFATTGVISVIADDPYDAWATANGVTGGKSGDHDLDGVSNLLEFATNSNGAGGSSVARAYPAMATLGGDSVLTLTVATRKTAVFAADGATQKATKDKIVYVVEGTSDLTTWDSVVTELNPADSATVQGTLTLPALDADWEWHTFRTDDGVTGDPRDYIRLRVSVAP
jgi:autotransporter-associated beta strand protein